MDVLNRFLVEARENLILDQDQQAIKRDLELALDYLESMLNEMDELRHQLAHHRAENTDLASRIEFILDLYRQDKERLAASANHHIERAEHHQKKVDTLTRILQEATRMLSSGDVTEANKMLEEAGIRWYTKQTGRIPRIDQVIGDMETRIRERAEGEPFHITDTDQLGTEESSEGSSGDSSEQKPDNPMGDA